MNFVSIVSSSHTAVIVIYSNSNLSDNELCICSLFVVIQQYNDVVAMMLFYLIALVYHAQMSSYIVSY